MLYSLFKINVLLQFILKPVLLINKLILYELASVDGNIRNKQIYIKYDDMIKFDSFIWKYNTRMINKPQ